MERVKLIRTYLGKDCTTGEMRDSHNNRLCFTLEEPWNDNKQSISCIPTGEYFCKPWNGAKFKDVWNIAEVPKRSAVLIHNGNTVLDIEGCVVVGKDKGMITLDAPRIEKGITLPKGTQLKAVLSSKVALQDLKDYIGRENGVLKTFILEIRNA